MSSFKLYNVPNEEIQIKCGGPIYNEKDQEVYFLACIDRFSNFLSVRVFDRTNAKKSLKLLQDYVILHAIPSAIRLDQTKCEIGQKSEEFCNHNSIELTNLQSHSNWLSWKANSNYKKPFSM